MAGWAALAQIERDMEEGLHVGAQLYVSRRGEAVLDSAMGMARPGVRMTQGTLMPWLSATKPITAAALLQQWDRGRLDLDDPVARCIPEFGVNGKEGVTLRHLLTHTSGLTSESESPQEVFAAPLVEGWLPGRRAAYRPRGAFSVLAQVVTRLDGRRFEDYVSEELFEPLGMADSWMALSPERYASYGSRMGTLHQTHGAETKPTPRVVPELEGAGAFAQCLPSLSGIGPMGELARFYQMLLGKGELDGVRVLSPPAAEAMVARHRVGIKDETFGPAIDWGLGVMVNSWHYRRRPAPYGYGEHASSRAFGHGGSQSSIAFADPDYALAVALVFNGMAGEAANHRRTQATLTALYEDLGLGR